MGEYLLIHQVKSSSNAPITSIINRVDNVIDYTVVGGVPSATFRIVFFTRGRAIRIRFTVF